MMTDTWTWATVTQASPLRIKVDGDTSALDATTDNLVGSLAVDDRVRVHLHSDGIIVTGIRGGGNRSNPNLLINSDFMVNQRGAVSGATVSDDDYFLDRWKNSTGFPRDYSWADSGGVRTVTVGTVDTSANIGQVIEQANVPAGDYTLSWADNVIGRVYNVGGTGSYGDSPVTVTLDGTADVLVELRGEGWTLSDVKFERGTVATPSQPPLYADNLRACYRYYQKFIDSTSGARFGSGFASTSTVYRIFVPLLAPLRIASPTVSHNDLKVYDGEGALPVSSLTIPAPGTNVLLLLAGVSGATTYRPGELVADSPASYVALDAEL